MLSLSDQHFPAIVPPQDGNCMAIVRMSNMSPHHLENMQRLVKGAKEARCVS